MGDVGAGGDGGNEGCEACAFPHRHRAHTCGRNTGGVGPLRAKPGDGDGGLSALGSGESFRAFTHSVCRESRGARVDGGACRWSPVVSLSAAISCGRRCGSSGLYDSYLTPSVCGDRQSGQTRGALASWSFTLGLMSFASEWPGTGNPRNSPHSMALRNP